MADVVIRDMSANADFPAKLEQELLADLSTLLPQAMNTTLAFAAYSASEEYLAGIQGSTSYGWLKIGLLWVHPDHRRRGFGRRLLDEMLRAAKTLGCHACWLDTSNPTARRFYEKQGFVHFGELSNHNGQVTPNHRRWFLQRHLGQTEAE